MANKLIEQARLRAAQNSGVLNTGQASMATGMASTAPPVINVQTSAEATLANEKDTGAGNAGEAPEVARPALSPTTTAPIDNERGGLPMAEDPDRVAGAVQAGQAVVKTIQPLVGVQAAEFTAEDEARIAEEIQPAYEPYEPVEGDYRALRLKQFYKADGKKVTPNSDGWYHPADEEEAQMLEYYSGMFDKVEAFEASGK